MITLNLTSLEKSEIKYKLQRYPDGQQNILIYQGMLQRIARDPLSRGTVQIKARLNSFKDLELIICATKILQNHGIKEIHLYVPYFLGARSDRTFDPDKENYVGNHYLKDVICPIINSLNFSSVTVLDPHSHVLEACLNNFKKKSNLELAWFGIKDAILKNGLLNLEKPDFILVSPDEGASKKIYKLAEQIGYKGDIIICSKERDVEGNLTKCVVPSFDLTKDIVLIDDIFDYGTTFKNISAKMNDMGHQGKKYLIVTHAIQDKGLVDALKWFNSIFTTNSYKNREINNVKILNIF